jgi:NAD(P)H-hydrate epimerase
MKIVTAAEMKAIEQQADAKGLSYATMMENAGRAVADEALRLLDREAGKPVLILVGPGNNGGDGLVAARYLHDASAVVNLYVWKRKVKGDANFDQTQERRIPTAFAAADEDFEALRASLGEASIVIDALLGTGVTRPIRGTLKSMLAVVRDELARQPATVLAVDLPSGLNPDTGAVDPVTLPAGVTVTFAFPKRGFYQFPGADTVGRVVTADIGIPPTLAPVRDVPFELMTTDGVRARLPARPIDAHKNTFGRALVVAGSVNYPGAAYLAAAAATRVGAGLVTLATARSLCPVVAAALHAATYLPLPEDLGAITPDALKLISEWLPRYRALLVGPGLGTDPATFEFVQRLLGVESDEASRRRIGFLPGETPAGKHSVLTLPPTVVDADGLNALAAVEGWPTRLSEGLQLVLTPHAGEMARLIDLDAKDAKTIDAARLETARRYAVEWGQVVVLKGAHTVVAGPDGRAAASPFANPALATAGTGDVLAGAIVGLLAQGLTPFDAAVCGVFLHAQAGEQVRDEIGAAGGVADDLLPRLPTTLRALKTRT